MSVFRDKILSAFTEAGEYSHVLPVSVDGGYVDGLFHVAMLAGAARLEGDMEVQDKAEKWIRVLLQQGDVRNWRRDDAGNPIVTDDTPQSFAGPCALAWAIQCGCRLPNPYKNTTAKAWALYAASPFVFLLGRWFSGIRQHVNSCMLACLLIGMKPVFAWWLCPYNPFYSKICGKFSPIEFEGPIHKATSEVEEKDPVPIELRPGSAWLWKQNPYSRALSSYGYFEYTPTALYVARAIRCSA